MPPNDSNSSIACTSCRLDTLESVGLILSARGRASAGGVLRRDVSAACGGMGFGIVALSALVIRASRDPLRHAADQLERHKEARFFHCAAPAAGSVSHRGECSLCWRNGGPLFRQWRFASGAPLLAARQHPDHFSFCVGRIPLYTELPGPTSSQQSLRLIARFRSACGIMLHRLGSSPDGSINLYCSHQ
jgi:hypothetical protein